MKLKCSGWYIRLIRLLHNLLRQNVSHIESPMSYIEYPIYRHNDIQSMEKSFVYLYQALWGTKYVNAFLEMVLHINKLCGIICLKSPYMIIYYKHFQIMLLKASIQVGELTYMQPQHCWYIKWVKENI